MCHSLDAVRVGLLVQLMSNAIHHACRNTEQGDIVLHVSMFAGVDPGHPWLLVEVLFTGPLHSE